MFQISLICVIPLVPMLAKVVALSNAAGLTSPASLGKGGETYMKRILVLLTMVALMVVMLAMAVAPAFALAQPGATFQCINPDTQEWIYVLARNKDNAQALGYTECHKISP
jgi:hypothetical protein